MTPAQIRAFMGHTTGGDKGGGGNGGGGGKKGGVGKSGGGGKGRLQCHRCHGSRVSGLDELTRLMVKDYHGIEMWYLAGNCIDGDVMRRMMLNSMTPAQIRAFMGHTTGGDKGGGGNGGGGGKKGGVGKSGGGGKGRLQCHRCHGSRVSGLDELTRLMVKDYHGIEMWYLAGNCIDGDVMRRMVDALPCLLYLHRNQHAERLLPPTLGARQSGQWLRPPAASMRHTAADDHAADAGGLPTAAPGGGAAAPGGGAASPGGGGGGGGGACWGG
ncbi:hypothetical protein OCS_02800 [Ophiocordyceps sinensis CO18]|uniref:Uncharacterized protein n=1 Tax=Ophiocordyceps sinensis (strain Co18 / CGMCC 3.14243) TaxID=911162 RepID=T5AFW6_OPHSC|nr:hypothetical protein OCS_02800 [Ophiocordyceps sinensis CO18]